LKKHDEIKQKLFALYDGPLSETERSLVEEHIPSCVECRRAIEEWQKISGVLFTLPAFSEASEDQFVAKVMARLPSGEGLSAPAAAAGWNTWRWLVPLAGSAIAAAWVYFFVLSDSADLNPTTNVETAFSSNSSAAASGENGIMLASYSPSNELVP
jgi:anti-sigma factor RsiW